MSIQPNMPATELSSLLSQIELQLELAESALAQAQPEVVVQAAAQIAPLCRDLKRMPASQWTRVESRDAILGRLSTRAAALQQAVGRAQARIGRELATLLPASAGSSTAASGQPSSAYDAQGAALRLSRAPGTYA